MPSGCSPRSVLRRLATGPIDEAVRPCASEAVLEATLSELRDDLASIDRMIRMLEWADRVAERPLSAGESDG